MAGYLAPLLMTLLMFMGLLMIFIVLLQRGRGGGLAGAFGGLGGQSAFGTKAGDVFTKITVGIAIGWVVLAAISGLAVRAAVSEVKDSGAFKPEDGDKVPTLRPAADDDGDTGSGEPAIEDPLSDGLDDPDSDDPTAGDENDPGQESLGTPTKGGDSGKPDEDESSTDSTDNGKGSNPAEPEPAEPNPAPADGATDPKPDPGESKDSE